MGNNQEKEINDSILDLFTAPHLRVNKHIKAVYGLDKALWLADVLSKWSSYRKKKKLVDGFCFIYQKEIKEETDLSFDKQTEIIKFLKERNIITVKRKGLPAKNWYRINVFVLAKEVEKRLKKKNQDQETVSDGIKKSCQTGSRNLAERSYNNKNNNNKNNKTKEILSKDNIDCKSNLADNFSNPVFNKDSLTKKIKQSLLEPEDFSKEVQSLFKFWQSLKIVNHKKSKSRNKALQDLEKALQKYSEEEIKKSMQTYKEILENPYNKVKKEPPYKVGLNQFFEFDKFTKDNIKNFHKDLQDIKSWFDICLYDEEITKERFTRKTKDKNLVLTEKIIEVMQRKNGQTKLTDDQLDMCRKASNRILDLWTKKYKNKKDFNLTAKKYILSFWRGYILPWIEDTANKNEKFGVHWLLSEHFEKNIEEFIKTPYRI